MNNKIIYLRRWLSKTIAEHPEVIDPSNAKQTPTEIYSKLFEYWTVDIQEAMKSLLVELKKRI